jgi:hypothetical protein
MLFPDPMPGLRNSYNERSDAPQFDEGSGAVGGALAFVAFVVGAGASYGLYALITWIFS